MVRPSKRSAVNHPAVFTAYSRTDARLDLGLTPHTPAPLAERLIREAVRTAGAPAFTRRRPLRQTLYS